MFPIILRRLALSVPLLVIVSAITFLLESFVPGDPARTVLGINATQEQYDALRAAMHLDQPVVVQYWLYLRDAVRLLGYVPAEDLHFFGVSEADIKALKPTKPLHDLLRYEVARTRALYEKGRPLISRLGGDLRRELALIWMVGVAILDKIEDADYDVFTQRPSIGARDKAKILARAAKHWASHFDLKALKNIWP